MRAPGLLLLAAALAPAGAVVHLAGPPPAHTGGFGEPTCLECHEGYELNLPGGALRLEGLPERWEPGRRYLLTVVLESEGMGRAGFQLAARFARGEDRGRPAGILEAVDGRTQVVPAPETGIPYAGHTLQGVEVADETLASWTLAWTAPRQGAAEAVAFHAAANSAGGDDSPLEDLVYTTSATVEAPGPS